MNKHGWTYKKLGEVATIISGSTPKTNIPEYWDGAHFWVTPAELGKSVYIGETERTITDDAVNNTNLTLLPVGTVLLSSRAPIGKIAITTVPMYCNQGFKNIVCSEELNNKFTYYFIGHIVPYLQSLGRGATFKEISKTIVENVKLPVPSMEEQLAIVAELDEINEAIEALQQQVADLDALAQSTFYTMFGDPVTNEKGWEVDKLNAICDVRDGTHDSPSYIEMGFPLITSKNVINGAIDFDNVNYISKEDFDNISKRSRVDIGDIIMPMIGTIGRPAIVKTDKKFAIKNVALIKFVQNSSILNIFLISILSSPSFDAFMKKNNKGGTQKFIALGDIRKLPIILPPIVLQQEFAAKVKAIESTKAEINAQISEMQNLLASRMDYYFD